MFDFANTFFRPEALTSQSWCSLVDYTGALIFDPTGQHVRGAHMGWTTTDSPSDTGGKAATGILGEKLLSLWLIAHTGNTKINYSFCDGKVDYISDDEVDKLSRCTKGIFVATPAAVHIGLAMLAQFLLLAKGHVFLGPFFLATFVSTFVFYGALYSFLCGRFILRAIPNVVRRVAHIPRINSEYVATNFVGLSIFVALATGFLLVFVMQRIIVL
jgi:hypothetical protein